MNAPALSRHSSLDSVRRLRLGGWATSDTISKAETIALLACGIAATAMVTLAEFKLRIPGHSILRAVFPMAFGLALVPRRGAGTLMGLGAVGTAGLFGLFNVGDRGLGSMTSLCLIGPALDVALRRVSSGRGVYIGLTLAGIAANLAALLVQTYAKSAGWDAGGGKSVAAWLPFAAMTYPTCGGVAGLVSAIAWFRCKR